MAKDAVITTSSSRGKPYAIIGFTEHIISLINYLGPVLHSKSKAMFCCNAYFTVIGRDHSINIILVFQDLSQIELTINKDDTMNYTYKYQNETDENQLESDKFIKLINILFKIFCKHIYCLVDTPDDNEYLTEIRSDNQISRLMTNGISYCVLSLPPVIC